jgi:stearoyl-CoA desaturase (delta-9 desaturase)
MCSLEAAHMTSVQPAVDTRWEEKVSMRPWNIVAFATMSVLALAFGPSTFSWPNLGTTVTIYYLTVGLGYSVGFHRGIIHRTFRAVRPLQAVLAVLGTLGGGHGPLSVYRAHTARSYFQSRRDAPSFYRYDRGFIHSACKFLFKKCKIVGPLPQLVPDDVAQDPLLRFLQSNAFLLQIVFMIFLYAIGGWALLVWAGFVRLAVTWSLFATLDYVVHTSGYVRYPDPDASTSGYNSVLLGIIMMGEGWHNNHHGVARSARIGQLWWELDLGYVGILALEKVGLISDVIVYNRAPEKIT